MLQARSQKHRISNKAHFDLTKLFSTSLKQVSKFIPEAKVEIWSCRDTEMLNPSTHAGLAAIQITLITSLRECPTELPE